MEAEPKIIAADVPVLDSLQPRMEQIIFAKLPNIGRLCGYCYNHLAPDDQACVLCSRRAAEYPVADAVPRPVLRAYYAKRRREAWMVNSFAYVGMFLGVVISFALVSLLPGWWRLTAVFTLIVGSWYLANVLGGIFGGNFGYNWGRNKRSQMWAAFVDERDGAVPGANGRATVSPPDGTAA